MKVQQAPCPLYVGVSPPPPTHPPRKRNLFLESIFKYLQADLDKHIFWYNSIGLSPDDSFDQAVADIITDTVSDLKTAIIKANFEKDEAKKVQTVFDWVLAVQRKLISRGLLINYHPQHAARLVVAQ